MSQENMDANTESESSTESQPVAEETKPEAENTPAEESSAQPKEESDEKVPFHKHPRFKELVDEKNELQEKLSRMERLLEERDRPKPVDPLEVARAKLKKLGVQDEAAKDLLDVVDTVSSAKVASLERATVQQEINNWIDQFSRDHEDYKELEPEMFNVFKSLPEKTQVLLASDPSGLQFLYDHVKMSRMDEQLKEARENGVKEGYKNKKDKSAVTTAPGRAANPPTGELTPKAIEEMSLEDYKKRRDEIMKALKEGKIRQ